ncbi:MAG: hypothetical protein U1E97_09935 [Alphaproteobacteria bacterium]
MLARDHGVLIVGMGSPGCVHQVAQRAGTEGQGRSGSAACWGIGRHPPAKLERTDGGAIQDFLGRCQGFAVLHLDGEIAIGLGLDDIGQPIKGKRSGALRSIGGQISSAELRPSTAACAAVAIMVAAIAAVAIVSVGYRL